jgi:hypothetical protein
MQLDTTREVTGIDEEQRPADKTIRLRIENNSFLHRYLKIRGGLDLRHSISAERSYQTAVLVVDRSTGLLSKCLGLLLLVYNYIHKHNIINKFAFNWVRDFERGGFDGR